MAGTTQTASLNLNSKKALGVKNAVISLLVTFHPASKPSRPRQYVSNTGQRVGILYHDSIEFSIVNTCRTVHFHHSSVPPELWEMPKDFWMAGWYLPLAYLVAIYNSLSPSGDDGLDWLTLCFKASVWPMPLPIEVNMWVVQEKILHGTVCSQFLKHSLSCKDLRHGLIFSCHPILSYTMHYSYQAFPFPNSWSAWH